MSTGAEPAREPGLDPRGRHRILDDQKKNALISLVQTGISRHEAARTCGCTERTLRNETQRDPRFADRLNQAEGKRQIEPLEEIHKASKTSWRAAAWLLERLHPEQFCPPIDEDVIAIHREEVVASVEEILREEIDDDEILNSILIKLDECDLGSPGFEPDDE